MKKILFTVPALTLGGVEKTLIALANNLSRSGYDVTVLTWKPKDDISDELDNKVHLIYRASNRHLGNRIPYIRYKFYDDDMWDRRANPSRFYRYYVGSEKYDVEIAFFHDPKTTKIIYGSRNKKALRIAWVHIDFSKDTYINRDIESGERSKDELFRVFSSFDRVICVSDQAADAFRRTVGDTGNITVIYNILPLQEIKEKAAEKPEITCVRGKLHVVVVGRLVDKIKGQTRLIRAIKYLREEGKDITLALIGAGQDEEMITEYIREMHLSDAITVVGMQRNPYPYIREADLLVCSSFEEGYNLTVAEALILETPVLSTDCTGPNEILDYGRYGFVVENSDEGLYLGLKYLYENPSLLEYYRRASKARQSFFDETRILREVVNLFEEHHYG